MSTEHKPGRLTALDHLRGYFILVIIIDHLYRWPSAFAFFTGEGVLWFNAADGFVIVSGLMIGYVRGFKGMKSSLWSITQKLWKRAALLYLWLIIGTLAYTGFAWLVPTTAHLPYIPISTGDWSTLITQTLTLKFSYVWVNFLYLYAIFLAVAPVAIWLLRQRLAWVVGLLSLIGFIVGDIENIKWLQWQALFFLPTIAGFYLESIRAWWLSHPRGRHVATYVIFLLAAAIMSTASLIKFVLPSSPTVDGINAYFNKDHLQLGGVAISLLVFSAYTILFVKLEPFLKRRLNWILMPFGTHSLTVYIIHGVVILLLSYLLPTSQSIIVNTLTGIIAIMGALLLLKIPWVTRFIPR